MAVNDVRLRFRDARVYMPDTADITGAEMARERMFGNTKRQIMREPGQHVIRAGAAGTAVGDQPNMMPAGGLAARKIDHMPEQPADRRAKNMQDVQWT
jgi:hypothetical protein